MPPKKQRSLAELSAMAVKFRNDRNWAQFHTPKDLAANLVVEAAELLEVTQWRSGDELAKHLAPGGPGREAMEDELSDVVLTVLLLAHDQQIDLPAAFERKMRKNEAKYPVSKARGSNAKYDKL